MWKCFWTGWEYPIIQYSFPDEESFKVDILNESGYWFWKSERVTQIFDLNGVNVHQRKCKRGDTDFSSKIFYVEIYVITIFDEKKSVSRS
jgi:hypothetical protein